MQSFLLCVFSLCPPCLCGPSSHSVFTRNPPHPNPRSRQLPLLPPHIPLNPASRTKPAHRPARPSPRQRRQQINLMCARLRIPNLALNQHLGHTRARSKIPIHLERPTLIKQI